jgi:hypothetical protein
MSITLTYAATPLALPDDLLWRDEHDWRAVEQRQQYTITGALIVEAAAKQAGRTITLEGSDECAWIARSALGTLTTWAALAGQTFTLNLRGVNHTVVFDQDAGAISARPVWEVSDPDAADPYVVTLRFLKV